MALAFSTPLSERYPSVSVIIPVRNSLTTLGRALVSVRAQSCDAIVEVIVVDDGSEQDIAGFLAQHFPNVICLRQERGGPAAARNRGVACATGDLVAFLDADDEWLPDKLERQLAVLAERPEADILLSRFRRVYASGRSTSGGAFPEVLEVDPHAWFSSSRRRHLKRPMCPSGWLIKRGLYLQLGGQDTSWTAMSDWHLVMRALVTGHHVLIIGEPLFNYHICAGSVSSNNRTNHLQWLGQHMLHYLGELQEAAATGEIALDPAACERLIIDERIMRARMMLRHGYLQGAYEMLLPVMDPATPMGKRLAQVPTLLAIRLLRRLLGPRSQRLQSWTVRAANWYYQLTP